ncbi:Calcium-dependent lipid-binding domain-containing protein [Zostera marina]|uniref:Calcium-dependent lipid-binding domain-containing protein n=1 Tax=Zostera marina TaxID=29655 RepID=A0A0K9P7G6_ZOSMR|nr:Calcium-dependent lipid-binding domain-containing protein [Zostera marina]
MASQVLNLNSLSGEDKSENMSISSAESTVVGCLNVYIHQAGDIHNICIYQKQDVYAKIFLISNPKNIISTKTINHGGSNPIFNESLQFSMGTNEFESSLRCEIWMLSRAKNYLEDQFLGFALIPLVGVFSMDGKMLTKKFSLASNDLFDSQVGFVEISLSYAGFLPQGFMMTTATSNTAATLTSMSNDDSVLSSYYSQSDPFEFAKVEFPDLKVDTENQLMVSEFLKIHCDEFDSQFSPIVEVSKRVNTIESIFTSASAGNDSPTIVKEENREASEDGEAIFTQPLIKINVQPEQPVVQQEIVDMYIKSLQEFTDSLAKMKLPMDVDNGICTQNEALDLNPCEKEKISKENRSDSSSSRVFYGSNAFF